MIKQTVTLLMIAGAAVFAASSFISANKAAVVYKINPAQSSVKWVGKKVTGEHSGNVTISGGSLTVTNNSITAGSVDIDLANLTVTDITDAATNAKLVGHLKSADFFNTAVYPKATLVITSVKLKTKDNYDVTGNLTIKGITNPITFPAVIPAATDKVTATAVITIDRTKYDIKYRSASFFGDLGDKAIDNNFILNANVIANK